MKVKMGKKTEADEVIRQQTSVTTRRLFYRAGDGVGVHLVEEKDAEGAAPRRVRVFITENNISDIAFSTTDGVHVPPRPRETAMRQARASAAVLREVADELERLAASVLQSSNEESDSPRATRPGARRPRSPR